MGFHAFKMADKIARKEGHRQVFVEYVNEIADNSRTASFRFYEDFTEIGHNTVPWNIKKVFIDQLASNHCLGSELYEDVCILIWLLLEAEISKQTEILVLNNCQLYLYSVC